MGIFEHYHPQSHFPGDVTAKAVDEIVQIHELFDGVSTEGEYIANALSLTPDSIEGKLVPYLFNAAKQSSLNEEQTKWFVLGTIAQAKAGAELRSRFGNSATEF